jgi:hypothetical protein
MHDIVRSLTRTIDRSPLALCVQYFADLMAVYFHWGFKSLADKTAAALAEFKSVCASLRTLQLLDCASTSFAFVLFGVVRHSCICVILDIILCICITVMSLRSACLGAHDPVCMAFVSLCVWGGKGVCVPCNDNACVWTLGSVPV